MNVKFVAKILIYKKEKKSNVLIVNITVVNYVFRLIYYKTIL